MITFYEDRIYDPKNPTRLYLTLMLCSYTTIVQIISHTHTHINIQTHT